MGMWLKRVAWLEKPWYPGLGYGLGSEVAGGAAEVRRDIGDAGAVSVEVALSLHGCTSK